MSTAIQAPILISTGISLPVAQRDLLRECARVRQRIQGGRVSASAILIELIARHEAELSDMVHGRVEQIQ